jgi:hypothetical protein
MDAMSILAATASTSNVQGKMTFSEQMYVTPDLSNVRAKVTPNFEHTFDANESLLSQGKQSKDPFEYRNQ